VPRSFMQAWYWLVNRARRGFQFVVAIYGASFVLVTEYVFLRPWSSLTLNIYSSSSSPSILSQTSVYSVLFTLLFAIVEARGSLLLKALATS
jgi:hypothetical protein